MAVSIGNIRVVAEEAASRLGYDRLKDLQFEVIAGVIAGNDVFAVLPTGFGKSLCYGCLPLVFDRLYQPSQPSIVCVISPLTAIIEEQVESFSSKGLSTGCVTGDTNPAMLEKVVKGEYQLVFFTPEVLFDTSKWRKLLRKEQYMKRMKALVIDEAHTVKKWGETFRKSLLRIGEIRSLLNEDVKILAMTATATRSLRLKISEVVGMVKPLVIAVSPCRRNLMYAVSTFKSISDTFTPILEKIKRERVLMNRIIIYCRRYDDCSNLYLFFRKGLGEHFTDPIDAPDLCRYRMVEMFTSSTDDEVKTQIIKSFSRESPLRIVCATVAFGMGVDCPDIRQVIHFGAPDDLESYVQHSGRGGRDGKPSLALLLVVNRMNQYCDKGMLQYQKNVTACRRDVLFQDMDNYSHIDLGTKCMCCDVCGNTCQCGSCKDNIKQFIFV